MADGRSKPRPGAEAQREHLLEVALTLFAERGSQAVSIAEICRAAEVSRPTFYRCFPDKEAVLAALYEQAVHAPIRLGLDALTAGNRPGQAVVDEVIDAIFAHPREAAFLFTEARDPTSDAAAIVGQAHRQAVAAVRSWQRAQGRAVLSETTLEALMVAWQWMVAAHLDEGEAGRGEVRRAAWELAKRVL